MLFNVLEGRNKAREAKSMVSNGGTHTKHRLHQMMLEDPGIDSPALYSPQLEETETLHIRLQSTSKDLLAYIKQRI